MQKRNGSAISFFREKVAILFIISDTNIGREESENVKNVNSNGKQRRLAKSLIFGKNK